MNFIAKRLCFAFASIYFFEIEMKTNKQTNKWTSVGIPERNGEKVVKIQKGGFCTANDEIDEKVNLMASEWLCRRVLQLASIVTKT